MIGGANWSPWNGGARVETLGVSLSGATAGTTLTPGASNVKGSWADIGGTTGFAYKQIMVAMANNGAAADAVVDIGINVGGNRFIIAEDLRFASSRRSAAEGAQYFGLPLFVPAGAQLSGRVASSSGAAGTIQVAITGFSAGIGGVAPFSRCRALYTPSLSRGVTIDPGGTANTKGAYAELVASSGFNAAALMCAIGFAGDVSRAAAGNAALDIAMGASSSEQLVLRDFIISWGTIFDGPSIASSPIIPCYAPSGTRFSARSQSTITTAGDRNVDLALWGFEP